MTRRKRSMAELLAKRVQQQVADMFGISIQHANNIILNKRRTSACPEEMDAA